MASKNVLTCSSPAFTLMLLFGWALFMTQSIVAANSAVRAEHDKVRLHVVFDNLPNKAGLKTGWGFACLIDGLDKVVLFDTGGNGDILLSNMQQLGVDARAVEAVVLSHIHGDHTGGLDTFLARNPDVTVYMPESFPASFQRELMRLGAAIETVSEPRQLLNSVHSTGEMNHGIKEQALIVDTPGGAGRDHGLRASQRGGYGAAGAGVSWQKHPSADGRISPGWQK